MKHRKWAVIIGISDYAHPNIADLKYAAEDAKGVMRQLVEEAGFSPQNIFLLVNEQATLREMKRIMGEILPSRVAPEDLVFLFYAGHGAPEISAVEPDGYTKYLVPYDADPSSLYSTALPMDELQRIFNRIRSRSLVMAVDACYSGAGGGRTFGAPVGTRDLRITERFLDDLSKGQGRIIISASGPNEPSLENEHLQHGLFTYYLLEALGGKADADKDSTITLREAYDYLYARVSTDSQQRQHPMWKGEATGQIIIVDRRRDVAFGNLTVRTMPTAGTVFVDGQLRGVASPELIVTGLPIGQHEILVRKDGYAEARRTLSVQSGTQELSLEMQSTRGSLRVSTIPAKAKVVVDGIERGESALEVANLAPGLHRLQVTLQNHVAYEKDVEVRAGESAIVNLSMVPMSRRSEEARTGILQVTSQPSEAQIYVDGALVGTSPITLESLSAGHHRLRASKRFYRSTEVEYLIEPKVVAKKLIELQPLSTELTLLSDLGGGTLFIDQERMGELRPSQTITINAGPHRIRIIHPQAGEIIESVELEEGSQRIEIGRSSNLGNLTILSDVQLESFKVNNTDSALPPVTVRDIQPRTVLLGGTSGDSYLSKKVNVKPGETTVVRIEASDLVRRPTYGAERTLDVKKYVQGFCFSPDGQWVVTWGGGDDKIIIWDVASGREVRVLDGHKDVKDVALSSDGRLLASLNREWYHKDRTVKLWDVVSGRELRTIVLPQLTHEFALSPNGKTLAISGTELKFLATDTGQEIGSLPTQTKNRSLAFSPDGESLAVFGDSQMELWEVKAKRLFRNSTNWSGWNNKSITKLSFSANGQVLMLMSSSGDSGDKYAALCEVNTLRPLRVFRKFVSAALSYDGKWLATVEIKDKAALLRFWETTGGVEIGTGPFSLKYKGTYENYYHESYIAGITFDPKGSRLGIAVNYVTGTKNWPPASYGSNKYRGVIEILRTTSK